MPDRSDVEQALAGLIADALYPNGVDSDSAVGVTCRIYRGWPVAGALDADLAQGIAHVTVQPVSGTMRDRTRYSPEWQGAVPQSTLVGSVEGDAIRFTGTAAPGQVAGVRVDGVTYVYRLRAGDTADLVTSVLAAQIRVDRPAVLGGEALRVPGGRGVLARVVTDGAGARELRRQEAGFRVTLWCPDPATRDRVASAVDIAIATTTFLDVGGWACRVRLSGGSSTDQGSAGSSWRRDLLYSIEYPTVLDETLPAMLFGVTDVNDVPFVG